MTAHIKNSTPSEARENAGGQIPISFSLECNLPRKWPITSSEVKKNQSNAGHFRHSIEDCLFS